MPISSSAEQQSFHGLKAYPFEVSSDWHQAKAEIVSFEPEELFGTKLRALLQPAIRLITVH
jgi:hypothetical protein